MRKCSVAQTVGLYQKQWGDLMRTLENIAQMVGNYGELWKNELKPNRKRWALSELLKLLENCGLARHMWSLNEVDS